MNTGIIHHHQVPSSIRGLDAMVRQSSLCCAVLTAAAYDFPDQSLMFVVQFTRGRPLPRFALIFPSSKARWILSCLIMWPKYFSFLVLIKRMRLLLAWISCRTSLFETFFVHEMRSIRLYDHISNASSLLFIFWLIVHVSAPYNKVDHT